jgi:hypothetical protein
MDVSVSDSTVAEPDGSMVGARSEPAWNAATSYTIGQRVSRASVHRCFVAIAAGVSATAPEDSPLRWVDDGPTNRWAMFDASGSTQTLYDGDLTVVVTPSGGVTDISFFRMENVLSITLASPGLLTATFSLLVWYGEPWVSYYFDLPQNRAAYDIEGIQVANDREFTLTFEQQDPSLPVAIGIVAFGRYEDLGCAEFGASASVVDYSRIDTDVYGNTKIVQGRSATDLSASTVISFEEANRVKALVERYRATPCAWRIDGQAQYDYLRTFGLGKVDVVADGPAHAKTEMTIRGLV